MEVTVVDDCGNFLTAGNVTASFSDSDPSLPLTSLDNGIWSATWQPRSSGSQVVITVDAAEIVPPLEGTQSIGGALQANPTTPSVYSGGVVSAAKSSQNQPLSLGGFTSIYGVHLSAGQNPAPSLPLATQLGATQVTLGGRPLPLQYAGDGQVNAVIPYDVPPNTTQQLIVTNGPALSVPEPVVIAPGSAGCFRPKRWRGRGLRCEAWHDSPDPGGCGPSHERRRCNCNLLRRTGPVTPPMYRREPRRLPHIPATTTNQQQ